MEWKPQMPKRNDRQEMEEYRYAMRHWLKQLERHRLWPEYSQPELQSMERQLHGKRRRKQEQETTVGLPALFGGAKTSGQF